jgi:hypothetical protein
MVLYNKVSQLAKFELAPKRARLHDSFGKGEDKLPAELLITLWVVS